MCISHTIPGTLNSTMTLVLRTSIGSSFPRADERKPHDQLRAGVVVLQVVSRIFLDYSFSFALSAYEHDVL